MISELKQVEGEASCNSRKGKLIFFYEWNIKLAWKGNGGPGKRQVGDTLWTVFPFSSSSSCLDVLVLPGSDSYTSLHYSRCLRSLLSAEPFLPASVTRASWSCCLEHPSSTDACFHQKCLISKLKKLFMCVYTYLGELAR